MGSGLCLLCIAIFVNTCALWTVSNLELCVAPSPLFCPLGPPTLLRRYYCHLWVDHLFDILTGRVH